MTSSSCLGDEGLKDLTSARSLKKRRKKKIQHGSFRKLGAAASVSINERRNGHLVNFSYSLWEICVVVIFLNTCMILENNKSDKPNFVPAICSYFEGKVVNCLKV